MASRIQCATPIDIFTDGSYLHPGKENREAAGGCGIVIVKDGSKRTISCASAGDNSNHCEFDAIDKALRSMHAQEWCKEPKSAVTLHTDQMQLVRAYGPGVSVPSIPPGLPDDAKRLMKDMQVQVRFLRERKAGPDAASHTHYFNEAHGLASVAAWTARLEKQGYIHFHGKGRLEGEEAKAYLARKTTHIAKPSRGV